MKENLKIKDKIITSLRRKKPMKDSITLKGEGIFERRRKDGTVIDREHVYNLIVNTGKERVAKLINGESSTAFKYIGIGESSSGDAAAAGDTTLVSESTRALGTTGYEASYKATVEKTFTFSSGESYDIEEAGLFDSATVSGSTMLDRFVFSTKSVDADTDLYVKITITVA